MDTQKQTTQEIPESNQVSVNQVADVLGVLPGRVYVSAWEQPVYLKSTDSSRIVSLSVEGIMRNEDGLLVGVVRVTLNDKPVQLPVFFSKGQMVWLLHVKALQAQPELIGQALESR